MHIKVDYHFHPNFPFFIPLLGEWFSKIKARFIWKAFEKHDLDMVIITEHSFKHPKKTFGHLDAARPKNAKTLIVPGVEVLTKEGTDVIVFAKDKKDIYSHKELLTPRKLSVLELIDFVKKHKELRGIVTHPFTPGKSGIINSHGVDLTKFAVKELGMVEVHNCSFTALIRLLEVSRLHKIMKKIYFQAISTAEAPGIILSENVVITGGSDAHRHWEIGDHMLINVDSKEDVFISATTKSGTIVRRKKYILGLLPNLVTISREGLMRKLRLYSSDKPF
jgi:hypothetical protein